MKNEVPVNHVSKATMNRRAVITHGLAMAGAGLLGSAVNVASAGPAGGVTAVNSSGTYNILDYGAVVGQLSTAAIQQAVDACHDAGGGSVLVPGGTFITGTIKLKSRVNLHLEQGAELLASENREDYHSTFRRHGIIFCEDATDISLTGEGVINGRGTQFYDQTRSHSPRDFDRSRTRQKENYLPDGKFSPDGPIARNRVPYGFAIEFYHCNQVTMKGVTIKDAPIWTIRYGYCDGVLIDGISILNNLMVPNSDGIHITVSRNIRIANCDIRAGDDAIAITGFAKIEDTPGFTSEEQDRYTYGNKTIYVENIQVTNCHLQSRSSGIRVGYGQHPIRRLSFNNIVIYDSNRGIGVFVRDASSIEELMFSNIIIETRLHDGHWWGNGDPIHLSAISRFEGEPVGRIRDVQFTNITATGEHGIMVYGTQEHAMDNIQFNNVHLRLRRGRETMTKGGNLDLRPSADRERQLFEHDIPGLYAQYVDNLIVRDFILRWGDDLPSFYTHGIQCVNVNNLLLETVVVATNPGAANGKDLLLEETTLLKGISHSNT